MRHVKSERLKKLESELNDLEQWLKLGLVPKKDIEKHKNEIKAVHEKIEEEKERLQVLRESGEAEEYIAPKRNATRGAYSETPSIPDIDVGDTALEGDAEIETEAEGSEVETTVEERDDQYSDDDEEERRTKEETDEEDESYFSDRNRWRRGGIVDPEANEW